jgi:hypothetical protein
MDPLRAGLEGLAEALKGEKLSVTRPILELSGGVASGPSATGVLTGGVAWGWRSTGLFEPASLHRLALSTRLGTAASEPLAMSATFGHQWDDLFTLAVDGGVTVKLHAPAAAGPIATLSPGVGPVRLYASGWVDVAPTVTWSIAGGGCIDIARLLGW